MSLFKFKTKKTPTSSSVGSSGSFSNGNYYNPNTGMQSQGGAMVPNVSGAAGFSTSGPTTPNPNVIYVNGQPVASKIPKKTPAPVAPGYQAKTPSPYKAPASTAAGSGTGMTEPTIGDALIGATGPGDNPYQSAIDYYGGIMNENIDPNAIFNQKLQQYQAQIDAINGIYAGKLAETRQQGMGRFGTARAAQARGGLLGSDFSSAQNDTITGYNNQQEDLVRQEQAARIAEIMGMARSESSAEIAAKRAAQQEGADSYTAYLAKSQERKQSMLSDFAKTLIAQGITDISQLGDKNIDELSKLYGVSKDTVKSAFNTASATGKDRYITMSDGSTLYDTTTGQMVAENVKNFSGGGSGGGGQVSQQAQSWADLISSGRATIANVPSAMRSQVSVALASVPQKSIVRPEQIDALLNNPKFDKAFGPIDAWAPKFGGEASLARNQVNQILAQLKLDGRKILKGQGSVSDWEGKTVGEAASTISLNLNEKIARRLLTELRNTIKNIDAGNSGTYTNNNQGDTDALLAQYDL